MWNSRAFQRNLFRCVGLLLVAAGSLLLLGNPLLPHSQARPQAGLDSETVEQKLAELESASRQAGLKAEEIKAVLELAKRAAADTLKLFQMQANGKLSDLENNALEKLVQAFGHPLEKELAKLREVAEDAGLTADETAAAERVALQEGFNSDAIILRYETGKLSRVEKTAFEKVIALQGHPRAKEIKNLTQVARLTGLSEQQLQTLRGLAARANWDLEKIKELKRTGRLFEDELSVMAKLEAVLGKLEDFVASPHKEEIGKLLETASKAGMTPREMGVLLKLAVRVEFDIENAKQLKADGKLSDSEIGVLDKLRTYLGR